MIHAMNDSKLAALRAEIDALDMQLVELLSRRAQLAIDVAEVKKLLHDESAFYRPEREAQVLDKIKSLNAGPLPNHEIVRLVREIMSACLALESRLDVACLGPEGTFTQSAALKHFGQSVAISMFGGIDQVFREVKAGVCQYGVVPVENSIEGAVNQTLDLLIDSSLKICGEVELRIHQNLLGNAESMEDIETVYSHEQSFAQCRRWLEENLTGAARVPVSSNAEAALNASKDKKTAAVAGESAGSIYNLAILKRNIEDDPDNTTRFLVLGKETIPASGNDKTSVLFAMQSKPGALLNLLACFADHNVNMTRIESRPSRQGMWEYVFFVDINGHVDDEDVSGALSELRDKAAMMKLLGSYPVAVI